MSIDEARDQFEKIKQLAESAKEKEIIITKSDKSSFTSSELIHLKECVQNKEDFNPSGLDYIDKSQNTLTWYGVEINQESIKKLEKEISLIKAAIEFQIEHEIKFVQEWTTEALLADLIKDPSYYGLTDNLYIYDKELRFILDILVRPGNLIDGTILKQNFDRMKIDFLSSNQQLIFNIRFMTLYNSKVTTERVKPLFKQWESSQ